MLLMVMQDRRHRKGDSQILQPAPHGLSVKNNWYIEQLFGSVICTCVLPRKCCVIWGIWHSLSEPQFPYVPYFDDLVRHEIESGKTYVTNLDM